MRIKLIISYDGTDFCGWQKQPCVKSIQEELENAYFAFSGERVSVVGSGRTDEGVHAIGQVAHFDTEVQEGRVPQIKNALNHYLPSNIRVKDVAVENSDFNARGSAKKKTYCYDIYFGLENPLLANRAHFVKKELDLSAMQQVAKCFVGTHDFINFRAVGSSSTTTIRTIYNCDIVPIELYGSKGLRLSITGNGFLYKMVRCIVGTILQVADDKLTINDITDLLSGTPPKPNFNKIPAPSYALYLKSVEY